MADQIQSSTPNVTEELYKKNLELVNANKEMTLLQKLYETMALKLNVEELAEEFIQIITTDLDFQGGLVMMRYPSTQPLQYLAASFKKESQDLLQMLKGHHGIRHLSVSHTDNLLVQAFHEQIKVTTENPEEVLLPLLTIEEAKSVSTMGEFTSAIVFPLRFGDHKIGSMAIFLKQPVAEMSNFEKDVLNQVSVVFGVAIDRVMIYQDLKAANKKLKELDKLKDEFVSIASHELRTPLTAIKGYLWLALNKSPVPLHEEVTKNLQIAHDASERLSVLVEDMLTISRIEGGRLKFDLTEYDVVQLLTEVRDELKVRAEAKKIVLELETSIPSLTIVGDKDRIREVIINLIGNALKFTPENGRITLQLSQSQDKVILAVKDTGPGISKEDVKKLFQKFSKLEHSYAHTKESGTGLGLYISKQIVDMHQGSISLESELGKGTSFIVTLPLVSHQGTQKN